MKVLVIDVGGTNIKVSVSGRKEPIKIPSGPEMNAARMAAAVKKATAGWKYEAVSIGYPGPVVNGKPMPAMGSYQGGRMLCLGLGTGLGSALVADGVLEPLELAHLPYRNNRTYEDYVGLRGYKRMGRKKWQWHVEKVVAILKQGLQVDYVILGGGNTKNLKGLPPGVRLGTNAHAILGGFRLWNEPSPRRPHRPHAARPPRKARVKVAAGGEAASPVS